MPAAGTDVVRLRDTALSLTRKCSLARVERWWRRLPGGSEAGFQLRDARIALGDCLLEPGPGRSMGGGFLVEPRLRRPASRNLLLYPFAHLLVGRKVFSALRVVEPQSAVFVLPHVEPERFAAQAEPAVDQGEGGQRPVFAAV